MTPNETVERLNLILAHAWMVRNFLKHAEEAENDEEILDVHRTIFDFIRAVEPSRERGDHAEYLRRMKNKLPKLRKAAEFFAQEFRRVSTHTNFEMASLSLTGVVRQIEEVFAHLPTASDTV